MVNVLVSRRVVLIGGALTPLAGAALASIPTDTTLEPLSPLYRKDIPTIVEANMAVGLIGAGKYFSKLIPSAKEITKNVSYGVLGSYVYGFIESLRKSDKDRLLDAADEAGVIRGLALQAASVEKDTSVILDALKAHKKIWVSGTQGLYNPNAAHLYITNTSRNFIEGSVKLGLRDVLSNKLDPQGLVIHVKAEPLGSGRFTSVWPFTYVAHGPKKLVVLDASDGLDVKSSEVEVHVAGIIV